MAEETVKGADMSLKEIASVAKAKDPALAHYIAAGGVKPNDFSAIEERVVAQMDGAAFKFNTGSALAKSQMDFYAAAALAISNPLPNRVCSDKASEFYDDRIAKIGVRFNGVERHGDVQEYDVEAGWIKVRIRHGNSWKQERGRYLTQRLNGKVEPYWKR